MAALLLPMACSGGDALVAIPAPSPGPAVADQCTALLANLPDEVDALGPRNVEPANALTAAWGDPAVRLRCGVDKPSALHRTSECTVIDGVGWLATQAGHRLDPFAPIVGDVVFTTVGRSAYVEVTIPDDYAPQGNVLVALAAAVKESTDEVSPCV